jgi:Zn-dependent alcohol dehydrogenase
LAQEAGCARIIGVDTNPAKEARAREMGLTDFVNPKDIKVGAMHGDADAVGDGDGYGCLIVMEMMIAMITRVYRKVTPLRVPYGKRTELALTILLSASATQK